MRFGPRRGGTVYEKDGEKYFVVDGHMHYWNAAPDNWVPGAEQYAKGWIECFHAYQGLGPPETHWPLDQFQKYSEERMMRDMFDDGHVDIAIFQPTNLRQWYKTGFNTAEWYGDSRGWSLKDPEASRYLEKCEELGVKNIHVHKGPTIWPLDKDAFEVHDVDEVATSFLGLNFIIEHVGLPRIEDFCFMATQEPNVYAGLAVVIGGLMHARPRFFAKVM